MGSSELVCDCLVEKVADSAWGQGLRWIAGTRPWTRGPGFVAVKHKVVANQY